MGYATALAAAGAKVLAYECFGDYQGSWLAKVEYKGEVGWIEGSYGSCSYCDSFQSEFDYSYEEDESYDQRLKLFGKSYLHGLIPQAQQEAALARQVDDGWYGSDYAEMLAFVKAQA